MKLFIHGHLTRYVKLRVRMRRECRDARAVIHAGIAYPRFPLKSAARENVPGIPGAWATRNFTYLARGPFRNCDVASNEPFNTPKPGGAYMRLRTWSPLFQVMAYTLLIVWASVDLLSIKKPYSIQFESKYQNAWGNIIWKWRCCTHGYSN